MKKFTLMAGLLTLLCLTIKAQNIAVEHLLRQSKSMFTEEEYRASSSVAPLCTDRLSWRMTRRIYSPQYVAKDGIEKPPLYLLVVEDRLYPHVQNSLNDYAQVVSLKTGYNIEIVQVNSNASAVALRKKLAETSHLVGCFFIGDTPYAQYQIENDGGSRINTVFPCDLYFMDLDGIWLDESISPGTTGSFTQGQDGIFDRHIGNVAPEIFVGRLPYYSYVDRLKAPRQINQYLQRLIQYWKQSDGVKMQALSYINCTWANFPSELTPLNRARFTVDSFDGSTHASFFSAKDYLKRLVSGQYSFVHLWAHSSPRVHFFDDCRGFEESVLCQEKIFSSSITPIMYNLFCCSAARWTVEKEELKEGVEEKYIRKGFLGGAYLYASQCGTLALIGSTKTGSMHDSRLFHRFLAETRSIGEAEVAWWKTLPMENANTDEAKYTSGMIHWNYGLTILGDPLVRLVNPVDLYMQDSPDDDGSMPNRIDDYEYNFWESEDIWIRNQRDGGTEHQNPIYREGQPVYVYARIRNRGVESSPAGASVTLRWSQAGISLDYDSFCGKNRIGGDLPTGGLIGTKPIPSVKPNESIVICLPWYIKDPKQYEAYTKDPWHYCLLAEIESLQEPISERMQNLRDYVKSYNNVAMKNIYNIEISDDDNSFISGIISIHNPTRDNRVYKIEVESYDRHTMQQADLTSMAEVSLLPDQTLYKAASGTQAELRNLQLLEREQRFVARKDLASMERVRLAPKEMGLLQVKFNFKEQVADLEGEYVCRVRLKDQETGRLVGGETYVIRKKPRPRFDVVIDHKVADSGIQLIAQKIEEPAIYRWRDTTGELLHEGGTFTISRKEPIQLEVEAQADGVKGDALFDARVVEESNQILSVSPNPAQDQLYVKVSLEEAGSLMITPVSGGTSYIYPIQGDCTLDVSSYPRGKYLLTLYLGELPCGEVSVLLK